MVTTTRTRNVNVPGPRGALLIGSALDLQRDQLGTYERAMREFGDLVRFVAGPPGLRLDIYAVFHPDGVQQVLASASSRYTKDNLFYREIAAILGDGLLTSEGEVWRQQRRTLQPLFTRRRVATYGELMAREAALLVDRWRPFAKRAEPVDLDTEMTRLTLRVVGQVLFGSSVDQAVPVILSAMPVLSEHARRRGLSPVRLPASWPTPANRRAARAQHALYEVTDQIIAQAGADGGEDLVTLLLNARDPETGSPLDPKEIRDQILIFLLAGHETTSTALTFALHLLGHHPEAQRRLREEVDTTLAGRAATASDLPALPYTAMVIKEAMRLYPPAYATGRLTWDGDKLLGHAIPPRSVVTVSMWATHRHPDFWAEPERFDPERFVPALEAGRHRYAYFPFGGGARACIGGHFAMLEAVLALATVAQAYELRTAPDPVPLTTGITLRPARPLPCVVTPRPA
jgi:cytochrome P450